MRWISSPILQSLKPNHFLKLLSTFFHCTNPHIQNNSYPPTQQTTTPNTPHQPNFLGNSRKLYSGDNALQVFGRITQPDVISWNLKISCCNQSFRFNDALLTFIDMILLGFEPDQFTYASVLSACMGSENIRFGEQIYSLVLRNGFSSDGYVCAKVIDMFSKSADFDCALRVFLQASADNVVCWNTVIAGGVKNGENYIALDLFCKMVGGFCAPNAFTFSSALSACAAVKELEMGRAIHAWVVKFDAEDDIFVGTSIIDLYAKCGDMDAAVREFSLMPSHNVVSWTAVISGFVQKDDSVAALHFFKEMLLAKVEVNRYTVTSVLAACSKAFVKTVITQLHCWILKAGFFFNSTVKDSLISAYVKIGSIQMSEEIFGEARFTDSPSTWSVMISGLVHANCLNRAIELVRRMVHEGLKPDNFCCSSVLSIVECVYLGSQIHSLAFKTGSMLDVLVGSALFTMYFRCGRIDDSYQLFRQMPERDRVAWSSMIAGFAEHGRNGEAFQLFREMMLEGIKPDQIALSAILTVCNAPQLLIKGKEVHGHAFRIGIENDTQMGGPLVTMYSKCELLVFAQRVFDGSPLRDQVIWSSLVSGYATTGHSEKAVAMFLRMANAGFEIDYFTSSSVLGVCATLSVPVLGRQLHARVTKAGLDSHLSVSSALVTMYSKCGSIDDSHEVFDNIEHPDLIAWTAMITGYARHGRGLEALKMFEVMKERGEKPDYMTLLGVLSACSHSGLVEEGFLHFNSMSRDYGIEPGIHHYACMVDLLGRAGKLEEAVGFINRMPKELDSLVWSTLLSACRVHGDTELGKFAAKKLREMEPSHSLPYISLSNISADMGDWEDVLRIRGSMDQVGMKKEPGWSIL